MRETIDRKGMSVLSCGHLATDFASGSVPALLPFLTVEFDLSYTLTAVLMLAVLGATSYALLNMTLRLPFYTQAKAFYGLSALVPLAFCFALGFDAIADTPERKQMSDLMMGLGIRAMLIATGG